MSMHHLPLGLTNQMLHDIDEAAEVEQAQSDAYDFRQWANLVLRTLPDCVPTGDAYAALCDLASNLDVHLTGCDAASEAMSNWNDIREVEHDALTALEAAIRADMKEAA